MRRPLAVITAALVLSGQLACATVVNGTHQTVRIETDPPGALLIVLPEYLELESPAEVELPRKLVHTVYAELEGYEPVYAYIDRIASPVRYANAFLTGFGLLGLSGLVAGLVGLGMDSDLGSAYELTPETLKIQLAPLPAAPAAPAPSSTASR